MHTFIHSDPEIQADRERRDAMPCIITEDCDKCDWNVTHTECVPTRDCAIHDTHPYYGDPSCIIVQENEY